MPFPGRQQCLIHWEESRTSARPIHSHQNVYRQRKHARTMHCKVGRMERLIVYVSPCTTFTLYSLSAELSIHLSIHQVLGYFSAGMKVDMSPVTVLGLWQPRPTHYTIYSTVRPQSPFVLLHSITPQHTIRQQRMSWLATAVGSAARDRSEVCPCSLATHHP
jgi:hypothetical protein